MKTPLFTLLVAGALAACNAPSSNQSEAGASPENQAAAVGQSAVQDDASQKDVVKVAAASPDHSTLVKAVQAAGLVDALSNAGPFTMFAPTNAAFDALPPGTLEDLLKAENKDKLVDILQYHVSVGGYPLDYLRDGQKLNQVNGADATITVKDGKYWINGANIVATVKASNGLIHVIDQVILPPAK